MPDLYEAETKVLVVRFDDVPMEHYVAIANQLRDAGVTSTVYVGVKKFGKQLDYAIKEHYSHVVILGASELEAGIVKVKDLGARTESEVDRDKLTEFFK